MKVSDIILGILWYVRYSFIALGFCIFLVLIHLVLVQYFPPIAGIALLAVVPVMLDNDASFFIIFVIAPIIVLIRDVVSDRRSRKARNA